MSLNWVLVAGLCVEERSVHFVYKVDHQWRSRDFKDDGGGHKPTTELSRVGSHRLDHYLQCPFKNASRRL